MTKNGDKWIENAESLTHSFQNAVEYNRRDDGLIAAWGMMEFLQETVAALKSNSIADEDPGRVALFNTDGTARTLDEIRIEAMRKAGRTR